MIRDIRRHRILSGCPVFILAETNLKDTIRIMETVVNDSNLPLVFMLSSTRTDRIGIITRRDNKVALTDELKRLVDTHDAVRPWRKMVGYSTDELVSPERSWTEVISEWRTFRYVLTPKQFITANGDGMRDDLVDATLMMICGMYRFASCAMTYQRMWCLPTQLTPAVIDAANPPITAALAEIARLVY